MEEAIKTNVVEVERGAGQTRWRVVLIALACASIILGSLIALSAFSSSRKHTNLPAAMNDVNAAETNAAKRENNFLDD